MKFLEEIKESLEAACTPEVYEERVPKITSEMKKIFDLTKGAIDFEKLAQQGITEVRFGGNYVGPYGAHMCNGPCYYVNAHSITQQDNFLTSAPDYGLFLNRIASFDGSKLELTDSYSQHDSNKETPTHIATVECSYENQKLTSFYVSRSEELTQQVEDMGSVTQQR